MRKDFCHNSSGKFTRKKDKEAFREKQGNKLNFAVKKNGNTRTF